jgi:ABC-type phosphate/phosphonate transport system substrate-binding protein
MFIDVSGESTTSIFRLEKQAKEATSKKLAAMRKIEAILYSETSINFYQATRQHMPEDGAHQMCEVQTPIYQDCR